MRKILLEPNNLFFIRLVCITCTIVFSFTLNTYSISFLILTLGILSKRM